MLKTLVVSAIGALFGVLQSTLLENLVPGGVVPDIAMIILVAAAWRYGSLRGEISGFLIGLSLDALSLAPFGFHALVYTLIGYASGRLQGTIAPSGILPPAVAVLVSTVLKYAGSFALALVFGLNSGAVRFFSVEAAWELLANTVLAVPVFFVVLLAVEMGEGRRGGFR